MEIKINNQIKIWLEDISDIILAPFPSSINKVRTWSCHLSDCEAMIPFGGTHVKNINKNNIKVKIVCVSDNEIIINTKVIS